MMGAAAGAANAAGAVARAAASAVVRAAAVAAALLAMMGPVAAAGASQIPAHIQTELAQARLAGQGSYSYFGLKIYDAQLWVGAQGYQASAPETHKFVLELRYARQLNGQKIAQASADQMEKIGAGTPEQRQAWLVRMSRLFPDVKAGTRLGGVFLPGQGARFYLDGQFLDEVPDPAFARAFFAIWLAPASTAQRLRDALLAGAAADR